MFTATETTSLPAASPLPSHNEPALNPFEAARAELIRRLLALRVPSAHAIAEVSEHIREAANIFDDWLFAIGGGVADRVMTDVDMRSFQGAFLGAVDGNATYEVECAAEAAGRRRSYQRRSA